MTKKIKVAIIGDAVLYCGDSREVLPRIAKKLRKVKNHGFHACVSDPPYDLTSGKKGGSGPKSASTKTPQGRARIGTGGFMNADWDATGIAFDQALWKDVMEVLRPGSYAMAFGGDRTYHRMACAIEDAGFEIRNMVAWVYGSGFPKSLNLGKAYEKAKRGFPQGSVDPASPNHGKLKSSRTGHAKGNHVGAGGSKWGGDAARAVSATDADGAVLMGWGTALKPALEPICMARKPLEGTAVANMLRYGVGGLNIDASRIPLEGVTDPRLGGKGKWKPIAKKGKTIYADFAGKEIASSKDGRWPANLIHDGSAEVVATFPAGKGAQAPVRGTEKSRTGGPGTVAYGEYGQRPPAAIKDAPGSAARFFYVAKANKKDRDYGMDGVAAKAFVQFQTANGSSGKASSLSEGRNTTYRNIHPTVKPRDLMRYLICMVTREGQRVLDPFMGSGSTGVAAILAGRKFVGIEQSEEFFEIACRRIAKAAADRKLIEEGKLDPITLQPIKKAQKATKPRKTAPKLPAGIKLPSKATAHATLH